MEQFRYKYKIADNSLTRDFQTGIKNTLIQICIHMLNMESFYVSILFLVSLVEGIMRHSIYYFTIVFNISLLQYVQLVSTSLMVIIYKCALKETNSKIIRLSIECAPKTISSTLKYKHNNNHIFICNWRIKPYKPQSVPIYLS